MVAPDPRTSCIRLHELFRGVGFVKGFGCGYESVAFDCKADVLEKKVQDMEVVATVRREDTRRQVRVTFVGVPKRSSRDI